MIDDARRRFPELRIPVVDGQFKLVYEPDPARPYSWMVNDHCLMRDMDGNVHFFGIENPFPSTRQALEQFKKLAGGSGSSLSEVIMDDALVPSDKPFISTLYKLMHAHLYCPGTHFRVGHAVAKSVWGPWQRCPAALDGGEERHLHGSPFVIGHEDRYWMFEPNAGTGIYTSSDLNHWKVVEDATGWEDRQVFGPTGHRDPCILRGDDGLFFQYFAAADAEGRHTISLATSADLRHWSPEAPCYVDANLPPYTPSCFGIFESPFVMRHGRLYYLFVGFSHRHYYETFVVVSADPRRFLPEHKITTLFTHAPEFIEIDGVTYMSSCGIEDPQCLNRSGLWMSRIRWLAP